MDTALHEICLAASWKAKAILRTNRFFSTRHLITIFKSHVLGFIEYRTPAIIHAASSVLKPIDLIFDRFLSAIGISAVDALIHFNLASLSIRRDIAALGIIHRAMLGKGPFHLRQFFIRDSNPSRSHPRLSRRRHSFQVLEVYDGLHRDYINRSVFGYIWIYNLLPEEIVDCRDVKSFQGKCQKVLKDLASSGIEDWTLAFSPRAPRNLNVIARWH